MDESNPHRGPLFRVFRRSVTEAPLTARRAVVVITVFTLILTLIGGVLAWLVDDSFGGLGMACGGRCRR